MKDSSHTSLEQALAAKAKYLQSRIANNQSWRAIILCCGGERSIRVTDYGSHAVKLTITRPKARGIGTHELDLDLEIEELRTVIKVLLEIAQAAPPDRQKGSSVYPEHTII